MGGSMAWPTLGHTGKAHTLICTRQAKKSGKGATLGHTGPRPHWATLGRAAEPDVVGYNLRGAAVVWIGEVRFCRYTLTMYTKQAGVGVAGVVELVVAGRRDRQTDPDDQTIRPRR